MFIYILLLFQCLACAESIDTASVLTIEDMSFSNYQIQKQLNHMTVEELPEVLLSYIDDCYLLAHAKKQGIFKDTSLLYQVHRMECEILSQPNGVFYLESSKKEFQKYKYCNVPERRYIERTYFETVLVDSNIKTDLDSFNQLFEIIERNEYKIILENKEASSKKRLFQYEYSTEQRIVTIFDFICYYYYSPLRKNIYTKKDLSDHIHNMVYAESVFEMAKEEDITNSDKFMIDRKNYHERLVLKSFLNSMSLIINSDDLQNYYETRLEEYKDGTDVIVDYVVVDKRKEGYDIFDNLMKHYFENDKEYWTYFISLKENTEYVEKKTVRWDNADYSKKTMDILFGMPTNHITIPLEIDNKWYIFFKHSESGTRTKSFEEVRPEIEKILHQQKLEQKKKELVAELKKKYTIVDNIDYDYYTSEEFLQSITADESQ